MAGLGTDMKTNHCGM